MAENCTNEPGPLTGLDLMAATAAWATMMVLFWFGSNGDSLRVTFVPGVAIAYLMTVWIWRTGRELPSGRVGLPLFFLTLAVQFVHFAEENATDFAARFPAMYGGAPYAPETFVTFNMVSYAVFTVSAIVLWCIGNRMLLVPVLFFCAYGALGNACSHLWWTIESGRYFPGLYTSLVYWILGPVLIHLFLGRKIHTAGFVMLYIAQALILLTSYRV